MLKTKILPPNSEGISEAARLLKSGEVVGIPTETVYGLAADATNPEAVAKIFLAKGRPQDNPLIVHIAALESLETYVKDIPAIAYTLAEHFWPGPLTMVLPKREIIPDITSGGLSTVGIRFPSNKLAREVISACGKPLAAPSANLSGSPSPTTAQHVFDDMNGRILSILDGGACTVGLESTVVSFEGEGIRLLRPGFVSLEDLLAVTQNVVTDDGILNMLPEGARVLSPGMKYKHYSPRANVTLVEGDLSKFTKFVSEQGGDGVISMLFDSDCDGFPFENLTFGDTASAQAFNVFAKLRECDALGAKSVFVRSPDRRGVGLAVYNRLLRAAGFKVVKL